MLINPLWPREKALKTHSFENHSMLLLLIGCLKATKICFTFHTCLSRKDFMIVKIFQGGGGNPNLALEGQCLQNGHGHPSTTSDPLFCNAESFSTLKIWMFEKKLSSRYEKYKFEKKFLIFKKIFEQRSTVNHHVFKSFRVSLHGQLIIPLVYIYMGHWYQEA